MMWQASKNEYYEAADIVYQTDQKSIEEEIWELKRMVLDHSS
jgi:hypothetical protein